MVFSGGRINSDIFQPLFDNLFFVFNNYVDQVARQRIFRDRGWKRFFIRMLNGIKYCPVIFSAFNVGVQSAFIGTEGERWQFVYRPETGLRAIVASTKFSAALFHNKSQKKQIAVKAAFVGIYIEQFYDFALDACFFFQFPQCRFFYAFSGFGKY